MLRLCVCVCVRAHALVCACICVAEFQHNSIAGLVPLVLPGAPLGAL